MSRQNHIKQLIINNTRRLQKLKEQQALYGNHVYAGLFLEIENIESEIEQLQIELKDLQDVAQSEDKGNSALLSKPTGADFVDTQTELPSPEPEILSVSPELAEPSAVDLVDTKIELLSAEPETSNIPTESDMFDLPGELVPAQNSNGHNLEITGANKIMADALYQEHLELLEQLRSVFRDANRRKFTFLLVGRTGVGKSSTINSLMGGEVSKVSHFTPGTLSPRRYHHTVQGIQFSIVDTPGLADSDNEANDQIYLNNIKREIRRIDCMWFVTKLGETRVDSAEMSTIRLISQTFGVDIWRRAVVVFTYADKVDAEDYLLTIDTRTKLIREEIAKHVGRKIAKNVPTIAVANDKKTSKPRLLPNGQPWLGELYTVVFERISDEGAVPFYLMTRDRLTGGKKSREGKSIVSTPALPERIIDSIPIDLNPDQLERVNRVVENNSLLSKVNTFIKKAGQAVKSFWSQLFG
ncbi:MAG: 50S ribosome-binding GTPase [Anaerolineae bacterium]|nr:50S ribosome-binding GTPase [Anaerolineae bacterium]